VCLLQHRVFISTKFSIMRLSILLLLLFPLTGYSFRLGWFTECFLNSWLQQKHTIFTVRPPQSDCLLKPQYLSESCVFLHSWLAQHSPGEQHWRLHFHCACSFLNTLISKDNVGSLTGLWTSGTRACWFLSMFPLVHWKIKEMCRGTFSISPFCFYFIYKIW